MAETKEKSETKVSDVEALSFPIAQLVADAKSLLGYESYEAAGGLDGAEGELTVAQAKARIAKWLAQPVKEA